MRRLLLSLAVPVVALAGLALVAEATAAPVKSLPKNVTRSPNRTSAASALARQQRAYRNQLTRRRNGQRVYVVQARARGSTRTALMTPDAAVAIRTRLRSQGYSAHIHNLGAQGMFVHYSLSNWRQRAVFANRNDANTAASVLRATGLSARVVTRN